MTVPRLVLRIPRGLSPLRHRNFALLWIGFFASNTGRWIEIAGTVWLVYELTGSPVQLGLIGLARALPAIVLGPVAGVLVDRLNQRKILFTTQLVAGVLSLTLGLLVVMGLVQLWHVYVLVTAQSAITAFDASARQALFPRLIPRNRLVEAVTLHAAAGRASKLLGPLIGGLVLAAWGEAAPFLLNAATFLALMAAVVLMRGVDALNAQAGATFRGDLIDGLRHLLETPILNGLLKLEMAFSLFQMNEVMITIIAREVLNVGPVGLGGLLAAPAAGALVGVTTLVALPQPLRQGRVVVLGVFAYAFGLFVLAVSQQYTLTFGCLAVVGFLDAVIGVTRSSVVQVATPGRMRGRIMSNFGTVARGIGPLSQVQSGLLAGAIGPASAVVGSALALVLAAGLTVKGNVGLWRFMPSQSTSRGVGHPVPTAGDVEPE